MNIAKKEIRIISRLCHLILRQAELYRERQRKTYLKKFNLDPDRIGNVEIFHIENVSVGKGSYFNGGQIHAGPNSKITIGENCAIGYNVHLKSYTHHAARATGKDAQMVDKDIRIGNNVWIGDNVYVKEGVVIGNNVVVGANSVVTKNIEDGAVVGGCPAKPLYSKGQSQQ